MASEKSDVLAPALVLPDQFFAEFAKRPGIDSERRLMLAVLEDAVHCYQRYALARDPRGHFEFDEAKRWIESTDREWPFSFENICSCLRIDPDYIRGGLRKLKRDALRGKPCRKSTGLRRERIYDRRGWRGQIK